MGGKEQKRVPELRFKGFVEDWEQRKFFDNIQKTIDFRGRTPKKLGMAWSETGYLALSALNVKNGYIDPSADAHFGNEELYIKWMGGRELRKGQVLFTTEAPMGNVAQVPDNQGYILSQRTITFDVKNEMITDDFLAVLLRSPSIFNDLSALSSGGTAKGVSQKSLSELKVIVPKNLCEQEKISLFFNRLDRLITLHQRKLEQLQNLKKAYLQHMFPSGIDKVPKLRFANFTDSWELCKLSDVAIINPKSVLPDEFEYVDLESVVGTKMIAHRTERKDKAPSRAQRLAVTGDVFYQMVRPYQKNNYLFDLPYNNYVFSTGYAQLRPFGDGYFLLARLQDENFVSKVLDRSTGTSYPAINSTDLSDTEMSYPQSNEEEGEIGKLFKFIDFSIIFQEMKLDTLNKLKSTYLQKMFI